MKQLLRNATLIIVAAAALACSSRPRPPIVTPPTPPCEGRDVVIYTLDEASNPIPDVAIHSSEGPGAGRNSDGAGFSHRWACGSATYTLLIDGWHTTNCGDLGASCELAGPEHRVHFARDHIEPPPQPEPDPPGANIDPVVGAIWSDGNSFGDDTGTRLFTIIHAGDLPLRWHAGGDEEVLGDLDVMASAGYQIVRMWSHIKPGDGVWSRGGSPHYNGLDALNKHDFVERQSQLMRAIADRGMRGTLETGGIDGINGNQERAIMSRFREVIDRAGAWTVAWVAPMNEPGSTHATSDDDGDNTPGHLRELARIATSGTSVLWHIGGTSNTDWNNPRNRFSQKNYTAPDQKFGYYHGYRAGHVHDKARHRFSWPCADCDAGGDRPGAFKRLWVDGEGVGAPVCNGSLRCVSTTNNGHEFDGESLSLIVAAQTLRGIGSSMSGNGVQRHHRWQDVVGFFEIPWTVRQFPKNTHTFRTYVHGGRSNAVFKAVTQGAALLRVEQSIADDGTTVAVAHSTHENQHWRVPVTRAMRVRVCSPRERRCSDEFSVPAGGSVDLGVIRWGRVLVGRPE